MKKLVKILITFSLTIIIFPLAAKEVRAAVISVSPPQKNLFLNETFLVEVRLNSEQQVINAIQATITYPQDALEVESVSQGGSFLTLWTQEPAVEQTAGIITFSGGIPDGSLVLDGKLVTINFRAKTPGGAEVGFDKVSTTVRLNDGKGTAAPLTFNSGIFKIDKNSLINISSSTHPNENAWYKEKTLTVSWSLKAGAPYSYKLSTDPEAEPDNSRISTNGTVTFTELSDGVYYFVLKEMSERDSWRIVGKRRAMIDSRPPLPIEAAVSREKTLFDNQYFVIFSTIDKGSGVDHFDIIENGQVYENVKSPYLLKDQALKVPLAVRAYDRAGNSIELSLRPTEKNPGSSPVINTLIVILAVLIFGLAIIILLFFAFKRRPPQ